MGRSPTEGLALQLDRVRQNVPKTGERPDQNTVEARLLLLQGKYCSNCIFYRVLPVLCSKFKFFGNFCYTVIDHSCCGDFKTILGALLFFVEKNLSCIKKVVVILGFLKSRSVPFS